METIDETYKKFNPSAAEIQAATEKMKELVESLLKQAKPEEKAELQMLYNAMVGNANSYQADSSSANLKDWRESKKELEEVIEKLSDKYDLSDASTDSPATFTDIKSVLAYLQGRGYQISRAGLYKHHKEGKFGKDKKSGQFLAAKIDAYAKNHLVLVSTGKKEGDKADALQIRKLEAEVRRSEAKATDAEYDLKIKEGQYIDREDMVRELVGRGLILDSSLRHLLKAAVPEIIELVDGNAAKTGLVMDEIMRIIDEVMNSYASTDDFVVDLRLED